MRELIQHFSKYRLLDEDFEFPDLLGAAYEYLIKEFADSAGKKGGEFYTPRDVVRLMVELLDPQAGMRVYDPCCGSGGMLIQSHNYVVENGGRRGDLALYGQDSNGGTWAICKMNMILHGIPDANIQNDDTLANPMHLEAGELMRFDRVITNPPFSINYSRDGMRFAERFRFFTPESGKKADLMFLQHMLAVLRPGGVLATVMPHGVLFRGNTERDIRKWLVDQDCLEAVIGLAPNLFYGTGIPACILVLRRPGEKPDERKGKVLFINADREYEEGRAQNYLRPEHLERIVSTYRSFAEIGDYSRIASRADLAAESDTLNIRRWADNAPTQEPEDVRAHLRGGVPRAELENAASLFAAHGFNSSRIFESADDGYARFVRGLASRGDVRACIVGDPGVGRAEQQLQDAASEWWTATATPQLQRLTERRDLTATRQVLMATFSPAIGRVGLLDVEKANGVIATWWQETQFDMRTLAARGYRGLVDSWVSTVMAVLEDENSGAYERTTAMDHAVLRLLVGSYMKGLAAKQRDLLELEGRIEQAHAASTSEDDADEEDIETARRLLGQYRRERTELRREVRDLTAGFATQLAAVRDSLTDASTGQVAVEVLREALFKVLSRYVIEHREAIVSRIEGLWDKYQTPLDALLATRAEAASRLDQALQRMGYERQ